MVVSEFNLGVRALKFRNQNFDWSKSQLLSLFTAAKRVLILCKVVLREVYSPIMLNPFCVAHK